MGVVKHACMGVWEYGGIEAWEYWVLVYESMGVWIIGAWVHGVLVV